MKIRDYTNMMPLERLNALQEDYASVDKQFLEHQKWMNDFYDSLDEMLKGNCNLSELTMKLNTISMQCDELLNTLVAIKELLAETRSELLN